MKINKKPPDQELMLVALPPSAKRQDLKPSKAHVSKRQHILNNFICNETRCILFYGHDQKF